MNRLYFKVLILICFISTMLSAQTVPEGGYKVSADEVIIVNESQQILRGNVSLAFKNSTVLADEVRIYRDMNIISAVGNVYIKDEFQELRADRVTYDLSLETGMVDNAAGLLNGEYYICAKYMHKLDKQYYIMEGARITTCEAPLPDWSFSFSKVEAEVDGYLFGDHATMNLKDMSFLYLPKLFFPLKVNRQTGFLIPRIGYSDELGYFFNENFFWAIDYDKDLTIGANYFTERGTMGLLEGRYVASQDTFVYFSGDLIDDLKKDEVDVNTRWSYLSKSKVSGYGLEAIADASFVSDYKYMRDFGIYRLYGNEWGNYENVFYQYYELGWDNRWVDVSLFYNESMKYKDNLATGGYIQTIVTQEPSITVQKYNLALGSFNVDYKVAFDNVYYKSDEYIFNAPGVKVDGRYKRIHSEMGVYYPMNFNLFNVTPSITGYYTRWNSVEDGFQIEEQKHTIFSLRETNSGFERFLPKFSVQVDLNDIYRTFGKSGRHTIVNTFTYDYLPDLDQTGLPDFLEDDIIETKHEIGWNLTNYFRGKSWNGELALKQKVDTEIDEQPFKPLEIKGNLMVKEFLYDVFEIQYTYYPGEINSRSNSSLIFLSNNIRLTSGNFRAYMEYEYNNLILNNYNTSWTVGGGFNIRKISADAFMTWKADNDYVGLHGLAPVENRITARWNDQCWSLGLSFYTEKYVNFNTSTGIESKRNNSVELIVSLKGLGEQNLRVFHEEKNKEIY